MLPVLLQEKRIVSEIAGLERDTGFKLRVLAQNYPETPGGCLARATACNPSWHGRSWPRPHSHTAGRSRVGAALVRVRAALLYG